MVAPFLCAVSSVRDPDCTKLMFETCYGSKRLKPEASAPESIGEANFQKEFHWYSFVLSSSSSSPSAIAYPFCLLWLGSCHPGALALLTGFLMFSHSSKEFKETHLAHLPKSQPVTGKAQKAKATKRFEIH